MKEVNELTIPELEELCKETNLSVICEDGKITSLVEEA
jgi:hypothetical protein